MWFFLYDAVDKICSGQMTFRHALAAPAFVAQAVDQIIADYIL